MPRKDQRFADLPFRIDQREIQVDGRGQTYGRLVPKTPPESGRYPLVVGLHYSSPTPGLSPYFGLGFVGQLVLPALEELTPLFVAPDAPDATWSSVASERLVLAVLAEVRKEFSIDERRTLLTGFSMGGAGTWYLVERHPDLVRAAIAIAAAPPAEAKALKTPTCVIHSRKDEVVPFDRVETFVKALEANGSPVTLTAVDDAAHHSLPGYIEALAGARPWIRSIWER